MGLIQTIKDFRKWRKEKYKQKYDQVLEDVFYDEYIMPNLRGRSMSKEELGMRMLRYGIEHRKEILKKVKIWNQQYKTT